MISESANTTDISQQSQPNITMTTQTPQQVSISQNSTNFDDPSYDVRKFTDDEIKQLSNKVETFNRINGFQIYLNPNNAENKKYINAFLHSVENLKKTATSPIPKDYLIIRNKILQIFYGNATDVQGCTISTDSLKPEDIQQGNINLSIIDDSKLTQGMHQRFPASTKLFHSSAQSGLKLLKPTLISTDGAYYATPRCYFYLNKPGSKLGSGINNNERIYLYELKSEMDIYVDGELGQSFNDRFGRGVAVYIETSTPLPIVDVTTQFVNN